MLIAMGLVSFLCLFMGCNPQWLYSLLPNGAEGYNPYDATHVINPVGDLMLFWSCFSIIEKLG